MLHRNMRAELTPALRTCLEDVLGNLVHARRNEDIGRLALLTYWDVRSWARWAHRDALAALASTLVIGEPVPSRAAFLKVVDDVIAELERIRITPH
ncbi:MAG TPA: hypothetical protein VFU71_09720 [Burkholderiaceae bacterium]|nr:hypothetical protein [Burkholderiaceae bacterium]